MTLGSALKLQAGTVRSVQSKVLSKLKIKAAGLLGEAATPAAQPGPSDGPAAKRQRAEPPPPAPGAAGGEAPGPSSTGAGASGAGAGRSGGGEAGDDDGDGLAGLLSAPDCKAQPGSLPTSLQVCWFAKISSANGGGRTACLVLG